MLTGLQHMHSLLRYVLLIFLVWSTVNALLKMRGKKPFIAIDNKLSLYTFILAHVQLLLGLALYFIGANGFKLFEKGMSAVMSVSVFRFFAVEHIVGMLVAIALITVGRVKSKKLTDDIAKHKTTFTFFVIALLIILVTIPWPFRNMGTAWI
tara:strand:- start:959 stop:1414 length:456 start_codon:yes stop_codon:yes gene_type:complete